MAATLVSMPSMRPDAATTASFWPVASMLDSRRVRYGLVSVNFSGSVETSPLSYSVNAPSSNSIRRRSAAPMRK